MFAMVLDTPGQPLRPADVPTPTPAPDQVLLRVRACAVCRTDVHIVDGELPHPKLPLILGHQIVGIVEATGARVTRFAPGDRVGVPWLGWTDGTCPYCRIGTRESLRPCAFHRLRDQRRICRADRGGRAVLLPDPGGVSRRSSRPAPLRRADRLPRLHDDRRRQRLGLYGFGNAAHILTQVARHHGREVYAFTRPGDTATQQFARDLGAVWAGGSDAMPPERLDAAILFAAAGELVPAALRAVDKGGIVVCAEIHMSDIPSFPYDILWEERVVRSVANLTRRDGEEFLALAPRVPVRTEVRTYPLAQANDALADLRAGKIHGAAVLVPDATN